MQTNLAFANEEFNSLSLKNQQAVFAYIAVLAKQQQAIQAQPKKRNAFGILKGRKFYMSKDFNKPLDDFEEYY